MTLSAPPIPSAGELPQADLVAVLAEHLARTRFEDLDETTLAITRLSILDTLGVTLAASGVAPGVDGFVELAREMSGAGTSTVWGFGDRVAAPVAAWANGAMAHCLDFDDLEREIGYHPSTPTVPTAVALAERDPAVSGRDLLLAVALGNDLGVRLAYSIDEWQGWFTTPLFGHFASTAAAAKVLGLDARRTANALGLVFTQAAGTIQMRWSTDSNIASHYAAWPNKAGVLSALLAQRGIEGIADAFEGPAGLYQAYFDGRYERAALTEGLGTRFRGAEVSFKPWPTCGGSHCPIDATLHVLADNGIRAADVERLTVATSGPSFALCEPLAVRQAPQTPMDARFSTPFIVAVAAVRGRVRLADFTTEALRDTDVLAFARRVTAVEDPSLRIRPAASPSRVEVTTRDGRTFTHRSDQPRGTYGHSPLSEAEIVGKFRDCAAMARRPLSAAAAERVVEAVLGLDDLPDLSTLSAMLADRGDR
jgi:2-methylcitrate dehydratase PrpD